jgi:hypothetical protein
MVDATTEDPERLLCRRGFGSRPPVADVCDATPLPGGAPLEQDPRSGREADISADFGSTACLQDPSGRKASAECPDPSRVMERSVFAANA